MDNFDLKTAENNAADKRYDEIPVFKQGIAIVRRYGKFGAVMVGGKEIVPPIYDGLSEFKDGYAVAKWNNEERVVNLSGQIRVLKDDKEIFLPEDYDWGFDFIEDICVVVKNGKSGFVNTQLELLLPCEYEHVEPLNDCIFKFKKEKKWGAVDKYGNVIAEADYVSIVCEAETLLVVEIHVPNGSIAESRYGLLDCLGNVILPAKCRAITRTDHGNDIFFIVEKDGAKGVLNKNGKTVVPFLYGQISISGSCFQCSCHRYGDICGVYNFHGEHFLNIDDGHNVIIPTDYELAQYVGYGLIKVSKDCKWGLIDFSGKIVIEPQYACIDKFDGSFARVGISLDEQKYTSLGNCWNNDRFRYGLIDMSGDVALPVEYERIEKWDNDYYVVRKEGLYGMLSPALYVVIEPSKENLRKLDDRYILVKERSKWSSAHMNGLVDYYGNEIIPAYKNLSDIKVLENGFLKVIYKKSQYKGCSHIAILNIKGKEVYSNKGCDDITYIGNGLLLIKKYAGHEMYNMANLQGKVLFENYYDYIKILENGNFLIYKNDCCGMAKSTGEIFVQPKYKNEIKFESGLAEVKISENVPLHKINEDGQVVVLDEDKNEVIIPKEYYWGTDFVNGISIVRNIKNDKLGVINKQGDVLITPEYDIIELLSDKTLLVQMYNYSRGIYYYGLYDISGKCIFPVIFKVFEYLDKDRIRVAWNLDETQSWFMGEYTPGPNKCLVESVEYVGNNRSALCDAKGNIITDKGFVCVGKFENGYARSYLSSCIENCQVKLKQVGVVDINGQIVIPSEYDGIILYGHSFARLRKGKVYGIADLKNKKTILFNDINIKNTESVDSFGRFIYTDGDCYNQEKNQGVIGPKGIIIPSGKYSNIELLENGLIKVSNEENTLYGLLGLDGKELLKMEYSYISSFMYGYATVCIGGHYEEDDYECRLVEGKWGIIDKSGKFIVECIHNEKQGLSAEDIIKYNLIDDSEFDSYGRLLFYDYEETNGCNSGVIGLDGIIVPTGKYRNIRLLDNGLIQVSNEENALYGLLDLEGKELLEMKYSCISEFKNGHASICLGGYNNGLWQNAYVGGKWGVIDDTGKIVIECIHNEEQFLTTENTTEKSLVNEYGEPILQILCSDSISANAYDEVHYDDYNDYYSGGYDDEPSIYDNPYYNDNLDMDQQSIEFWNSL